MVKKIKIGNKIKKYIPSILYEAYLNEISDTTKTENIVRNK
tara:strand:+ start:726 stop:848 length:123 start_codon:yes stop_codon:yes gene_type:complete